VGPLIAGLFAGYKFTALVLIGQLSLQQLDFAPERFQTRYGVVGGEFRDVLPGFRLYPL
jgi:hypothetical protein